MTATFYVGDAVTVMNTLPEKSVDLILTSPPFLALRSYLPQDHPDKALEGGSQATPGAYIDWLLDVVEACARVLAPHGSLCFELGDTYSGSGGSGGDYTEDGLREGQPIYKGSNARKEHRVTLADGRTIQSAGISNGLPRKGEHWPLAKSLSLIPESFRWAMVYGHNPHTGRQTEPWRLRNVIRWVRPNPPVGALGDKFRPATSELMVFCKAKDRFFDLDAVRTDYKPEDIPRWGAGHYYGSSDDRGPRGNPTKKQDGGPHKIVRPNPAGAPPLDWWNIPSDAQVRTLNYVECGCTESCMMDEAPDQFRPATSELLVFCKSKTRFFDLDAVREPHNPNNHRPYPEPGQVEIQRKAPLARTDHSVTYNTGNPAGAPPLDWWNIPPGGYPGAHYAVWPPELLVKPIKAMCPEKVCRRCGEARRRIVGEAEYIREDGTITEGDRRHGWTGIEAQQWGANTAKGVKESGHVTRLAPTLGFSDCGHNDYRPGLVLDPFAGSGTTLAVATGHGRDAIGIDLDERNYELALDRVGPLVLSRAA